MAIGGVISGTGRVVGGLAGVGAVSASVKLPQIAPRRTYDGDYTVTPGDEAVILETAGLVAVDNIVINPVPSGYGRITWNGSTLTVS